MCKNPQVDTDGRAVTGLMANVAAVVGRQAAAVSEDVYTVILREIPEFADDKPVLTRTRSSTGSAKRRRVSAGRSAIAATTWN
jgi:hypothetical protein